MTQPSPTFHAEAFEKPDGRELTLYGLEPVRVESEIPTPGDPVQARPVMRWHPLRSEWVMYAAHRLNRTFLPPPDYNPLAPIREGGHPTELPRGVYDLAVFENRFPSLTLDAPEPEPVPDVVVRAGVGRCEVVVFSQSPEGRLADLTPEQMTLLIEVWADRTTRLAATGKIRSVLAFENRGVEVGVTLHHPHGQIYAYDHIPPVQARLLDSAQGYMGKNGRPWLADFVAGEREAGLRVLHDEGAALSVVPPFARYTYETWVLPTRPVALLSELSAEEKAAFARTLKDALLRLDALFGVRMPYLLTVHQGPVGGEPHPEFPLHIEIYPYLRAPGRMKYLAGTEQGAGEFANDKLPEAAAAELRNLTV
ncbi:galactose-1-phosphate uridylyltransferase [Deinococcus aestuarii]|uniref:galactose-1-phosphate uridylyltransferase n=1 Tax=Deinococcus aestuarii TaxID=2774531 RepID=UPI001C0E17B3|nr:galactose-1-phosphate uridylyltransferase [Deinococcus aestuarii]